MAWQEIVTAGTVLLAFFGGITIIGNGVKVIKEWINPVAKLSERTEKLEQRADETDEEYEHLKTVINSQSRLLIQMAEHMISGNDIEKLKEKRDELVNAITEE